MCTVESAIHQNVKKAIVAGGELRPELIFRSLRKTWPAMRCRARWVEILNRGGQFEDVKDLVAASRGVKVRGGRPGRATGRSARRWGLIEDIPTVGELVSRILAEAEELITGRLADIVQVRAEPNVT